jgi:hypothetical protein
MASKGSEYHLHIDAFTPATIPMARLAEYMADLASLLGNFDGVHFVRVEEGTTGLVALVEEEAVPKVRTRLYAVKTSEGPEDAMKAHRRLDDKLEQDNASAVLFGPDQAKVIEFPGKNRMAQEIYGPFNQQGSVDGTLVYIGGIDETAHADLEEGNRIHHCTMGRELAKRLCPYLYGVTIRVFGVGRWHRTEEGEWNMDKFTVADFKPLDESTFSDTIDRLRKIEGNAWKKVRDPLSELRHLRHGTQD